MMTQNIDRYKLLSYIFLYASPSLDRPLFYGYLRSVFENWKCLIHSLSAIIESDRALSLEVEALDPWYDMMQEIFIWGYTVMLLF